jgi:hypothetical protein
MGGGCNGPGHREFVGAVSIGFRFFAFTLSSAFLGSFSAFGAFDHLLLDKPRFDELVP